MALYRYVKTYPKSKQRIPPVLPFVLMISGLTMLIWVAWPIVSFKLLASDLLAQTVSPLQEAGQRASVLSSVVLAAEQKPAVSIDYSNPNAWFPQRPQKKVVAPVNSYTISVPKLKIKNAVVLIAGDSLEKSLIHYGGTAMPGEYGNTVIFGHSTLPQLYDPTSYKTIFSLLPTLKATQDGNEGDEIVVQYDGATYRYIVVAMTVTKPNDVANLEQRYDDSYLTLVTCVPPGTYWERLYVTAKLQPLL